MDVTWRQALAWRQARQYVEPVGRASTEDVVRRLGAVPAWSGDPDLAVGLRRRDSEPGDVARALGEGRLLKTYAFRGSTHLMAPEDAGRYLALRAAGRMWERPSWQRYYGLAPEDWPALREVVRGAVAEAPATREEIGAAVAGHVRFRHLAPVFTEGSDTFLKPFAWQGDLCFGPDREGRLTFQAPGANPRWGGIPHLDEAGHGAVLAYLATYGPATPDHLQYWLGEGLGAGRRRITGWLADLRDRVVPVRVAGEPALHPAELLDDLAATQPTGAVRLLPGHDQWVLGPGTADPRVVPPDHRAAVSRGANLVLAAGVVSGTWRLTRGDLAITWFAEGNPPRDELEREAHRVAGLLDRPVEPRIEPRTEVL